MTPETRPDVVVVGAGIIGLASAWRLLGRGCSVTLVDPEPGRGASHAAAGMLAPVTEVHYGEEALVALTTASAAAYPGFVDELEDATGVNVGYRRCGTLAVAADADDLAALTELAAFQRSLGLEVEQLTARECRTTEPMLAPGVRGGLFVAGDHQVDNRRLVAALLDVVSRAGGRVIRDRATQIAVHDGAVTGVTLSDGSTVKASSVVVAAGCWSASLAGVAIRPVKGQILRLHTHKPFVEHNVRALVAGSSAYVVPRDDGEIVVGATVEEQGYDATVTAGGVYELLRDTRCVLPGITELTLTETMAGLRPGSPDNAPIVGTTDIEGLVVATGHGRNGILLAPVTADAVADIATATGVPDVIAAFGPSRFTTVSIG